MLYEMGEVSFHLHFKLMKTVTNGFCFKARETFSAEGSRCRQNLKFENFTWLFRRLRQGNKKLERHDYFSSFNQT